MTFGVDVGYNPEEHSGCLLLFFNTARIKSLATACLSYLLSDRVVY